MATTKKIIELIGAITTIYSYYGKDTEARMLINTWSILLKDYDDKLVESAFYICLQNCKMPPTPAEVIAEIKNILSATEPTKEELWNICAAKIKEVAMLVPEFNYTAMIDGLGITQGKQARNNVTKIWNELPDKIRSYIGSEGELIRMAKDYMYDGDFLTYEKPRFLKELPAIQKRQEINKFLSPGGVPFLTEQNKK